MYGNPHFRATARTALLAALALLLVCTHGFAAEYAVAPTGDDGANGSKETPFKTISKGVSVLKAGDALFVAPGEYAESVTVTVKATEDLPASIVAVAGAWIKPPEGDGVIVRGSSHVSVRGLKVTGSKSAGIVVTESRHITIDGCISGENTGSGVSISLSDQVALERCQLYGSKEEHGVHISATDHPAISDCKIRDNALCGVYLSGDAAAGGDGIITGAFIARNFVMDNGAKGGSAIKMEGVEKSTLERNVLDDNLSGGIEAGKGAAKRAGSGNRFIANVVRFEPGKGTFGIKLSDGSTRSRIEGSIISLDNGPAISVDEKSALRFTSTRNFYPTPGGKVFFEWKGTQFNFFAWRQTTGQDTDSHSATTDIRVGAETETGGDEEAAPD